VKLQRGSIPRSWSIPTFNPRPPIGAQSILVTTSIRVCTNRGGQKYLPSSQGSVSRPVRGVLDVGCGPGLIAVALAEQGLEVDAVDSVPEMIAMTRDLAAESNIGDRVRCKVSDVMRLPMEGERFDLALAVGVTEWLAAVDLGLQEMARVLKPGGLLIVGACITSSTRSRTRCSRR